MPKPLRLSLAALLAAAGAAEAAPAVPKTAQFSRARAPENALAYFAVDLDGQFKPVQIPVRNENDGGLVQAANGNAVNGSMIFKSAAAPFSDPAGSFFRIDAPGAFDAVPGRDPFYVGNMAREAQNGVLAHAAFFDQEMRALAQEEPTVAL